MNQEPLTKEEREERRSRRRSRQLKPEDGSGNTKEGSSRTRNRDKRIEFLSKNEGELLNVAANVNRLYEDKLGEEAPFMTFVLIGMQSSGKSTFMERLLNAVLNIVQQGTGTRCPLDVTCIHDETCVEPRADLEGKELKMEGKGLSVDDVFVRITNHNKDLAKEDRFSTQKLRLKYRAKNVQNMRFLDTPGIISNKSGTGKDNREDIKGILRDAMMRENTKLCVLLEATEFAKNPIIDFLDESLGEDWKSSATFLMPKFDKQIEDCRSASRANDFFSDFLEIGIHPYLVITPTLDRENLETGELFQKRMDLLAASSAHEAERFKFWLELQRQAKEEEGDDAVMPSTISERIGFKVAQAAMRKELLEHTLGMLPKVIKKLQSDLNERQTELQDLKEKQKFTDPRELKLVVKDMLYAVQERVAAYLDGDLLSSMKYSDRRQTLDDEITGEEESDWTSQALNFHTEKEEMWRSHIAEMDEFPEEIQENKLFLGGKQVHRAIEFFRAVMIDSLPDPFELEELVPNAVGYGGGSLMRENCKHATKQICMVLMQNVTHPGINYLVKHIGYILRRLFHLALEDIEKGPEFGKTFRLMPDAVKDFLVSEFDSMLWCLMKEAAEKIHTALEPLYSTIDPHLPSFLGDADEEGNADDEDEPGYMKSTVSRFMAVFSGSSEEAKSILKQENKTRAQSKKPFLRDERTSMITDEETQMILNRSFQYLVALMEFSSVWFRLQINHFLYESFKQTMKKSFVHTGTEANWEELIVLDDSVLVRISELEGEINGLQASLSEVQRMNQRL